MNTDCIICALQGNDGKKQAGPPSSQSSESRNAQSSESKLTTFELYEKFFNERRIGEEQKLIRPIRDGRLRLNNTRLQRYKKFQGKRFSLMANVGTNSSTRNILYQIPTPPHLQNFRAITTCRSSFHRLTKQARRKLRPFYQLG